MKFSLVNKAGQKLCFDRACFGALAFFPELCMGCDRDATDPSINLEDVYYVHDPFYERDVRYFRGFAPSDIHSVWYKPFYTNGYSTELLESIAKLPYLNGMQYHDGHFVIEVQGKPADMVMTSLFLVRNIFDSASYSDVPLYLLKQKVPLDVAVVLAQIICINKHWHTGEVMGYTYRYSHDGSVIRNVASWGHLADIILNKGVKYYDDNWEDMVLGYAAYGHKPTWTQPSPVTEEERNDKGYWINAPFDVEGEMLPLHPILGGEVSLSTVRTTTPVMNFPDRMRAVISNTNTSTIEHRIKELIEYVETCRSN